VSFAHQSINWQLGLILAGISQATIISICLIGIGHKNSH